MNVEEIRNKQSELKKSNRLIEIQKRQCKIQDLDGLRKIIKDNPEISCIEVSPINPPFLDFIGCNEYFYKTDDDEFNKVAREQILRI